MKYIVGYSGGADSTYTAHKLQEAGHDVLLVHLMVRPDQADFADVLKSLADQLNMQIEIIDISKQFSEIVIQEFVNSYKSGLTPNPCITCNEYVKFKVLNEVRQQKNFDKIATGHYAKILDIQGTKAIANGKDQSKDQSYMLYRLYNIPGLLNNLDFPLGDMLKTYVIQTIDLISLPLASTQESQDICFIKGQTYSQYIQKNYPAKYPSGPIYDMTGDIIGQHDGIINFTVGQRHGMAHNQGQRLYVMHIDRQNNSITIGPEKYLYRNHIPVKNFFLVEAIRDEQYLKQGKIYGKTRYTKEFTPVFEVAKNQNQVIIKFADSVRAPTPGQHCVLYMHPDDDYVVIGGGQINNFNN